MIRYVPSGSYFGRVEVDSKLIRRSLDTHVLEAAKLRLSDLVKEHRRFTTNGPAIKGEAMVELFRKEIDNDHHNTERTKLYKREILIALKKSWPGLFDTDISRISQKDCREWAARHGRDYSPALFNGAVQIVRRLLARAPEEGYRNDNPALIIKRFAVKAKQLNLPKQEHFHEMATHIETSGAAQAKDCANLFRLLAFSGVRINEARHVSWADVNFEQGRLQVRITRPIFSPLGLTRTNLSLSSSCEDSRLDLIGLSWPPFFFKVVKAVVKAK